MILVSIGYLIFNSPPKDFSYLENKKEVKKLAEAFSVIENRAPSEKVLPAAVILPLAVSGYELFLDKNNSYHVLLSYKIRNRIPTVVGRNNPDEIEKKLRDYEKDHALRYEDEIEKILKASTFEKNIEDEYFLIDDLSIFKPEEIINIIEVKLNKIISDINQNENLDERHFKSMLSIYMEKIRHSNIDEVERRKLLKQEIKSPKLIKILNAYWEMPGISTGE